MTRVVAASDDGALVAFGAGAHGSADRTIADLRADVARVAARLGDAPLGQVIVIAQDRYLFAVGLLAAWSRGHTVVLPPNAQSATIDALAAEVGALTILHDSDASTGIDLRTCQLGPEGRLDWPVLMDDDRHAVTLFTSGSTRSFRGVHKSTRQLYRELATLQSTFALTAQHRVVATVPANHLYGLLFSVLWPLMAGAPFLREVPHHVEAIVDPLRQRPAEAVLVTVPAHLQGFARLSPNQLQGLRVFSSTAPLETELALALIGQQSLDLIEVFGSTETGGIAWRRVDQSPRWTPLSGVSVSVDAEGHLLLSSDFLPDGGLFRTDDRVHLEADTFVHLGRADDIVKVGGRRISLGHIEQHLRQVPGVLDAAVVAVPDEGVRGTRILAAIVAPGLDVKTLRATLAMWLDPATTPRRYVFVDALPRETNGKLQRQRLLALFSARPDSLRLTRVQASGAVAAAFDVQVPDEAWFFEGHFPGFPILPGVATLHTIVLPAIAASGLTSALGPHPLREVRRLKFRHPIRPGHRLRLELTRSPSPRAAEEGSVADEQLSSTLDFALTRDGLVVASGRVRFS